MMGQVANLEAIKGFEVQKAKGISPWMLTLEKELRTERRSPYWTFSLRDFSFELIQGRQSLWVVARFPAGAEVAVRVAYCPDSDLTVEEIIHPDDGIENGNENEFEINVDSTIGAFHIRLEFPNPDYPILRCTTKLTPRDSLFIPYWPRDLIVLGQSENMADSEGTVYTSQVGTRSGIVYFNISKPRGGTVLYFQN